MSLDKYLNNYHIGEATIEKKFLSKNTFELSKKIVADKNILNLGLGNGFTTFQFEKIVKS